MKNTLRKVLATLLAIALLMSGFPTRVLDSGPSLAYATEAETSATSDNPSVLVSEANAIASEEATLPEDSSASNAFAGTTSPSQTLADTENTAALANAENLASESFSDIPNGAINKNNDFQEIIGEDHDIETGLPIVSQESPTNAVVDSSSDFNKQKEEVVLLTENVPSHDLDSENEESFEDRNEEYYNSDENLAKSVIDVACEEENEVES